MKPFSSLYSVSSVKVRGYKTNLCPQKNDLYVVNIYKLSIHIFTYVVVNRHRTACERDGVDQSVENAEYEYNRTDSQNRHLEILIDSVTKID